MSGKPQPVTFTWTLDKGEFGAMIPNRRFASICDAQFEDGEEYVLEILERGSTKSRGHFFATINEAWHSLPDHVGKRFPSATHFRKWAMVQCHYAHHTELPCPSEKFAAMAAAFIRQSDAYCVISIDHESWTVHRWSAESIRGMKRDRFQKMKTEVLDLVSSMVQTRPSELERAGRIGANG